MRVRCIIKNDDRWVDSDTHQVVDGPKYGEVCNVTGSVSDFGYDLLEYPCPDSKGWAKRLFVPETRIERVAVSEVLREKAKQHETVDMLN